MVFQPPAQATASPSEPSAEGLINRLRRSLASDQDDAETPRPSQDGGWLARIKGKTPPAADTARVKQEAAEAILPPRGPNMPALSSNDLRAYLNQRLASRAEAANDSTPKADAPKGDDKAGPVLKSLDAVLNHILASGQGGAPRAVLVAGVSPKVDATPAAIGIARALVARREQIVLVDLTRGPSSVSGALGMPRVPGISDLVAGRSSFEDVIRIDPDSPLQVIAAGNPKVGSSDENARFGRVFDALTQAYDCVVLHADREAVRALSQALKFELPLVVAVLPAGASARDDKADLADFSALGCPVLVYEQAGGEPRSRLLGRLAAG
jgi:Mrp family chromosome partitioning ATPase